VLKKYLRQKAYRSKKPSNLGRVSANSNLLLERR